VLIIFLILTIISTFTAFITIFSNITIINMDDTTLANFVILIIFIASYSIFTNLSTIIIITVKNFSNIFIVNTLIIR